MIDWQPISTAPKTDGHAPGDGRAILIMNSRGNCGVLYWSDDANGWVHTFSDGGLSQFWNGYNGSHAVAWASIPRDEDAMEVVKQFEAEPVS